MRPIELEFNDLFKGFAGSNTPSLCIENPIYYKFKINRKTYNLIRHLDVITDKKTIETDYNELAESYGLITLYELLTLILYSDG